MTTFCGNSPLPYCYTGSQRQLLSKVSCRGPLRVPLGYFSNLNGELESITDDRLGILEDIVRNPSVSSSYRNIMFPNPNKTVLEAQSRICTGPKQTRPLGEDQAFKVLDTILKSVKGELKGEEQVSNSQLGAFFSAMTIRATSFPEETRWSKGEQHAMNEYWPILTRILPPDVIFIADPEGSIMGIGSSIGPQYVGNGTAGMRLVGALREVLAGGHVGYEEVEGVLRDVFPLLPGKDNQYGVSNSLLSAFLIGQRMNRETDRELKAYCLAFDDVHGPTPVADVRSLTHYGDPYDGSTRYFRSTLFVAAVRSSYGESCLLHGVEWMPPKCGVTEEQMLKFMGANTNISPLQAKELLEDDNTGFAYVSLRKARPYLYSLVGLREHIRKRPPLATSEKVQQFVKAKGKEAIISGFYHEGFEEPLLMLMKRRGVHSGMVVKGEEGSLSMTTKLGSSNASMGIPLNYCSGFRSFTMPYSPSHSDGLFQESFNMKINAKDYGFEPTETPRIDKSVSRNIELGLSALRGEKGPAYDRIVMNAGMEDHLLGCEGAEDVLVALERAREAVDSGRALHRLMNYIKLSHKMDKM